MLQSSMWSQLARLKSSVINISGHRTLMSPSTMGPVNYLLKGAAQEIEAIAPEDRHWYVGGLRSVAAAVEILKKGKIIAVPTDTVYGFAGTLESNSIKRLYEIKKRDKSKPLAICVSNVNDVKEWGIIDNLPPRLLESILPGQVTIVLKRTKALNPALNPDNENVGIRVPVSKFLTCLAKLVGPLVLTSANESNQPSSLCAEEFSELWPELGGIFHTQQNKKKLTEFQRIGSTVVDLTEPGYFKVLRSGLSAKKTLNILNYYGLKQKVCE